MKKNILKSFFLLTGLVLMASCTSTSTIHTNMNSKSHSMAYIMDSKIADIKDSISVRIDSVKFNPGIMDDSTRITRIKSSFVPLVFIYIWESENTCKQGKVSIEENIPSFLKSSLISEVNRSGNFNVDSLNKSAYSLELSIDEIKTEGPYKSNGFFYFVLFVYGYSYRDIAGPAYSNLRITYNLKKNGQVVYRNTKSSAKYTEQIEKIYLSKQELQQKYAASMVEATSSNFKYIIESIVKDLNTYFNNQK